MCSQVFEVRGLTVHAERFALPADGKPCRLMCEWSVQNYAYSMYSSRFGRHSQP